MKLYGFGPAASAQRVRVFLAEKGLDIPTEQLNVRDDDQFAAAFTAMNPFHCVPFLELEDGTVIAESVSICRYLEELHPEPALFGRTAVERAVIDMWLRRFELDGLVPMVHAVRNHVPMFAGKVVPGTRTDLPQLPAMVIRGKELMEILLGRVEPHIARSEFVAGPEFTIADITGFFAIRLTRVLEMDIATRYPAVANWFAKVSARPTFQF
ncbi:glutathione S-transferase family protein [Bradyrhizobium sp. CER78]|uniref:glutathione S-transferase family protein n=1 Tax=Bradyrhizobium sp. CER78 TaxID=3039162 RepID=UPI00244C015A|nr:glutathione S-transferase family protein [Bradyrhizobium sp. CER78]MDH2381747.1 glutathione S-transferase family protein [Bradyrhizobium sp. CER78]